MHSITLRQTTSREYKIGTMTVVVLLIYSELYMHTVLLI